MKAPALVIHDGNTGLIKALRCVWKDVPPSLRVHVISYAARGQRFQNSFHEPSSAMR